jgi:hypothetical protein
MKGNKTMRGLILQVKKCGSYKSRNSYDDSQERNRIYSNIEVRGNAKPEDFDLPETSVAFSRVVAG